MDKQICRLCLKNTRFCFSIHESYSGCLLSTIITTLIPELKLGVSVNPQVCDSCKKQLLLFYEFRLKCLKSEKEIGQYLIDTKCSKTIFLVEVLAHNRKRLLEDSKNNEQRDTWDQISGSKNEKTNVQPIVLNEQVSGLNVPPAEKDVTEVFNENDCTDNNSEKEMCGCQYKPCPADEIDKVEHQFCTVVCMYQHEPSCKYFETQEEERQRWQKSSCEEFRSYNTSETFVVAGNRPNVEKRPQMVSTTPQVSSSQNSVTTTSSTANTSTTATVQQTVPSFQEKNQELSASVRTYPKKSGKKRPSEVVPRPPVKIAPKPTENQPKELGTLYLIEDSSNLNYSDLIQQLNKVAPPTDQGLIDSTDVNKNGFTLKEIISEADTSSTFLLCPETIPEEPVEPAPKKPFCKNPKTIKRPIKTDEKPETIEKVHEILKDYALKKSTMISDTDLQMEKEKTGSPVPVVSTPVPVIDTTLPIVGTITPNTSSSFVPIISSMTPVISSDSNSATVTPISSSPTLPGITSDTPAPIECVMPIITSTMSVSDSAATPAGLPTIAVRTVEQHIESLLSTNKDVLESVTVPEIKRNKTYEDNIVCNQYLRRIDDDSVENVSEEQNLKEVESLLNSVEDKSKSTEQNGDKKMPEKQQIPDVEKPNKPMIRVKSFSSLQKTRTLNYEIALAPQDMEAELSIPANIIYKKPNEFVQKDDSQPPVVLNSKLAAKTPNISERYPNFQSIRLHPIEKPFTIERSTQSLSKTPSPVKSMRVNPLNQMKRPNILCKLLKNKSNLTSMLLKAQVLRKVITPQGTVIMLEKGPKGFSVGDSVGEGDLDLSEDVIDIKEEPLNYTESDIMDFEDSSQSESLTEGEETRSASETSFFDKLSVPDIDGRIIPDYQVLLDNLPEDEDEQYDEPEYVQINQVSFNDVADIIKEGRRKGYLQVRNEEEGFTDEIVQRLNKETRTKPTTRTPKKTRKRVRLVSIGDGQNDEQQQIVTKPRSKWIPLYKQYSKTPNNETPSRSRKPNERSVLKSSNVPVADNEEQRKICVLYTNFTSEGDYINDHDYLINPYTRNKILHVMNEDANENYCLCLLCNQMHPSKDHIDHMKTHDTKCEGCNVDFHNVFILNLHVRVHYTFCTLCNLTIPYKKQKPHSDFHKGIGTSKDLVEYLIQSRLGDGDIAGITSDKSTPATYTRSNAILNNLLGTALTNKTDKTQPEETNVRRSRRLNRSRVSDGGESREGGPASLERSPNSFDNLDLLPTRPRRGTRLEKSPNEKKSSVPETQTTSNLKSSGSLTPQKDLAKDKESSKEASQTISQKVIVSKAKSKLKKHRKIRRLLSSSKSIRRMKMIQKMKEEMANKLDKSLSKEKECEKIEKIEENKKEDSANQTDKSEKSDDKSKDDLKVCIKGIRLNPFVVLNKCTDSSKKAGATIETDVSNNELQTTETETNNASETLSSRKRTRSESKETKTTRSRKKKKEPENEKDSVNASNEMTTEIETKNTRKRRKTERQETKTVDNKEEKQKEEEKHDKNINNEENEHNKSLVSESNEIPTTEIETKSNSSITKRNIRRRTKSERKETKTDKNKEDKKQKEEEKDVKNVSNEENETKKVNEGNQEQLSPSKERITRSSRSRGSLGLVEGLHFEKQRKLRKLEEPLAVNLEPVSASNNKQTLSNSTEKSHNIELDSVSKSESTLTSESDGKNNDGILVTPQNLNSDELLKTSLKSNSDEESKNSTDSVKDSSNNTEVLKINYIDEFISPPRSNSNDDPLVNQSSSVSEPEKGCEPSIEDFKGTGGLQKNKEPDNEDKEVVID